MSHRCKGITRALAAALVAAFGLIGSVGPAKAAADLTFGIVPQQSASRLAQIWVPLFEHLSEVTGRTIRFGTAKDIPTFEACLAQGAYDFAYMNPYHYTTFNSVAGYQAFARQTEKRLRGLIVVRNDSNYRQLEDLDGMAVAFPSPAAFGASVIPRAEMRERQIGITPNYVKSHDSVYRAVVAGLFPAGGGVLRTFGNIPEDLRSELRVLYETEAYTPHAFAAHPRVDNALVGEIARHMQALSDDRPDLLGAIGMAGVQTAIDGEWDDIRSLNLTENQTEIVLDERLTCHSG